MGQTKTARPDGDGDSSNRGSIARPMADAVAALVRSGRIRRMARSTTAGEIGSPDRRQTVTLNPAGPGKPRARALNQVATARA